MTEPKTISAEEYFEFERGSETKHEYKCGEVFAMTGASVVHNLIVANVVSAFRIGLRGKNCFVFPSDIKVGIDFDKHYVYPDVSVVCGKIETEDGRSEVIANPKIVVEVLSESTRDYDRSSKFKSYRKLSSLTDFITIDQYATSVEHHYKKERGFWIMREYENIGEILTIEDLDIAIPLSEIYEQVEIARG